MKKQKIYVINGQGGAGKDSFVEYVKNYGLYKNLNVLNYSSVYDIKEEAKRLGWTGEKTEKDRKFLSDLKNLTTAYNDFSYRMVTRYIYNRPYADVIFIHCREPQEIERYIKDFNAQSILVRRFSFKDFGNSADNNVENLCYNMVIENDGTLEELKDKAYKWVEENLL